MKQEILLSGKKYQIEVTALDQSFIALKFENKSFEFRIIKKNQYFTIMEKEGKLYKFFHTKSDGGFQIVSAGFDYITEDGKQARKKKSLQVEGDIVSPMPGKIFKLLAKAGDKVQTGDPLIVLEAMKMEHTIKATKDGVVKKILFTEGDQVGGKTKLIEFE
ncbi:acetyl-CoA carboxylase biotin carboxyl carrier protein subunit [Bacteriovoracaceae bacterium]|nr:acetyl-CoA carboxylase biotin carboxyl carrier protein subunit [Bacteriovoracaceae bacterium]